MDCFQGSNIYFPIGMEHILDINGYDHILFVIALAVMYQLKEWRRVLILVTAFTIGHSITLALSVLEIVRIPSNIIELLIPVTILLTALHSIYRAIKNDTGLQSARISYAIAMIFGFIHGMGFSNYLNALLGKEACIAGPLLMFNLGLELGQIVIVAVMVLLTFLVVGLAKLPHRTWKIGVSALVAAVSVYLLIGQWEGLMS